MKVTDPQILRDLADDIEVELSKLAKLEIQIRQVQNDIEAAPSYTNSFYESLALKFHSFYTSCERIFSLISNRAEWRRFQKCGLA